MGAQPLVEKAMLRWITQVDLQRPGIQYWLDEECLRHL